MIFDTDDFHAGNHRLDLLYELKRANPAFRMTAFAVPAFCPDAFLDSLPDWIEVVPHGWDHGGPGCSNPREAEQWSYERASEVLTSLTHPRWVHGWKSPGWQVSAGTYQALGERDWWIADHPDNNGRRPDGIRCHVLSDADHVHTHIWDVCGNGIPETFAYLRGRVEKAESFELVSEVVEPWRIRWAA